MILTCYLPVVLSMIAVPYVPMFVDTGANAIFARKTTVSKRINSGDIIRQILPRKPNNVTVAGIENAVQNLVVNSSAGVMLAVLLQQCDSVIHKLQVAFSCFPFGWLMPVKFGLHGIKGLIHL